MYCFPHFSHCLIISSSPKQKEKRKCIYFSAAAMISPWMTKRVLCNVVKQLQKAPLTQLNEETYFAALTMIKNHLPY